MWILNDLYADGYERDDTYVNDIYFVSNMLLGRHRGADNDNADFRDEVDSIKSRGVCRCVHWH